MGEVDNTTPYTEEESMKLTNLFLLIVCKELYDASSGGVDVRAYKLSPPTHPSEYILEVYFDDFIPYLEDVLTRGNLNKPSDVFQYEELLECRYETFFGIYAALIRLQSYILSPEDE